MQWAEEEVTHRANYTRHRGVASLTTICIYLSYAVHTYGGASTESVAIGTCLVVATWAFVALKRRSIVVKKWAVFAFYEATQLMVACASALLHPKLSGVFCLASTTVLALTETSPLYSKALNLMLCIKHLAVWSIVLDSAYGMEMLPHGLLPGLWSVMHVMLCVSMKREALQRTHSYMNELARERQRVTDLLRSIPDGIAVISHLGDIITHNEAFLRQFEVDDSCTMVALTCTLGKLLYADKFASERGGRLMDDVVEFVKNETGSVKNFLPVVTGKQSYLECRGAVMQWDERKVCLLTVRDTTKWIQLESMAERDSENKTALLRSVSHELRTPTNAILNLAIDLKNAESLSQQDKADMSMIVSATSFLLSLINDLLDFSRIANGAFSLMKKTFILEDTVQECLQLMDPQCRAKGIELKARIDPLLPRSAYTDQNRLRQVILNLLSNALK